MATFSQIINTDIYLIDQILKGRFNNTKRVLDVGCGTGRNLPYFLHGDFEVFGIDSDEKQINELIHNKQVNRANFKVAKADKIPFNNLEFDLIICNAVLHFANDKEHFERMLQSMWNRLEQGGILFMRLASNIGIEPLIEPMGNGKYALPDGTIRCLVDQNELLKYTENMNAELVEKIKTTNVQDMRCMTTWVLKK